MAGVSLLVLSLWLDRGASEREVSLAGTRHEDTPVSRSTGLLAERMLGPWISSTSGCLRSALGTKCQSRPFLSPI